MAEPSNHPLTDHNDPGHGSRENVIGKRQQRRSRRQLSPSDMSRIPTSLCVWRSKKGRARTSERVTYGLGNAYSVRQAQSSDVCRVEPNPRSCKAPTSFTAISSLPRFLFFGRPRPRLALAQPHELGQVLTKNWPSYNTTKM